MSNELAFALPQKSVYIGPECEVSEIQAPMPILGASNELENPIDDGELKW